MPLSALVLVLLAAVTHATWNLAVKKAADCRHLIMLSSCLSALLYLPVVIWIWLTTSPQFTSLQWLALLGTGILHLAYARSLQLGYRVSDLSLVYPLARGSGPLMSFVLAILLFDEAWSAWSVAGVLLIVGGIIMNSGLFNSSHQTPLRGIFWGLLTGCCIAAYTINDGWAVSVLLISPVLVDFAGNLFRTIVLAPSAIYDRKVFLREARQYLPYYAVVSALAPLGFILVLHAMRLAPISHVAPAREVSMLVGTLMGALILKEKLTVLRVTGVICIVGGVISLALLA